MYQNAPFCHPTISFISVQLRLFYCTNFKKCTKTPLFVTSLQMRSQSTWGCFITQIFKNVPKRPFLSPHYKCHLSPTEAVLSHKFSKMNQNAPFCHPTSSEYFGIFGIFWNILEYFGFVWNDLEWFGIFWNILEYFGIFWIILNYFGIFWNILDLFGMIWNDLEYFGI